MKAECLGLDVRINPFTRPLCARIGAYNSYLKKIYFPMRRRLCDRSVSVVSYCCAPWVWSLPHINLRHVSPHPWA